jgi:hypothetical protein
VADVRDPRGVDTGLLEQPVEHATLGSDHLGLKFGRAELVVVRRRRFAAGRGVRNYGDHTGAG